MATSPRLNVNFDEDSSSEVSNKAVIGYPMFKTGTFGTDGTSKSELVDCSGLNPPSTQKYAETKTTKKSKEYHFKENEEYQPTNKRLRVSMPADDKPIPRQASSRLTDAFTVKPEKTIVF